MTISNKGWSVSDGSGRKKMKATKLDFVCPECGNNDIHKVAVKRGRVFDPDVWYAAKENESTASCCAVEGVVKCDKCENEFFYRLELVPAVTTYKLTAYVPPIKEATS
jgi:predicted RNA-binding Zn-ribbon protein involved in translation (DUF1610 family)